MSMTEASSEYFDNVAGQWDKIRAGYFSGEVRAAAIRQAGLRPEHIVADVGAGTGYMSIGLAPLVSHVYVLDGSPAMLETARKNLRDFTNVELQVADGLSLPLPDQSLDAAFANMYLHHCLEPLKAIQEMVRVLRPGGRLVITDMDAHPFEWLIAEMADVWQGFERDQIRLWFEEAGLEEITVDCTGESCQAESHDPAIKEEQKRRVEISTFVAVGIRRS